MKTDRANCQTRMNYLQIPHHVFGAKLSSLELLIYCDVYTMNQQNREYWKSNAVIGEQFNAHRSTVIRAIQRLESRGLLERNGPSESERYLKALTIDAGGSVDATGSVRATSSSVDATGGVAWTQQGGSVDATQIEKEYIKKKSIKREKVVLPFETTEFENAWSEWKEYKRTDHRFKYKTAQSEQRALMKLQNEYTDQNEAIDAIHRAIANGWKGLVFKQPTNGRTHRAGARNLENSVNKQKLAEFARTGRITTDRRDVF